MTGLMETLLPRAIEVRGARFVNLLGKDSERPSVLDRERRERSERVMAWQRMNPEKVGAYRRRQAKARRLRTKLAEIEREQADAKAGR